MKTLIWTMRMHSPRSWYIICKVMGFIWKCTRLELALLQSQVQHSTNESQRCSVVLAGSHARIQKIPSGARGSCFLCFLLCFFFFFFFLGGGRFKSSTYLGSYGPPSRSKWTLIRPQGSNSFSSGIHIRICKETYNHV